jgi:Fur family ferric uptake transcriptional regulator
MTHAEELKSSGLKATLPRIKILEVFQQSPERHLAAEDVFKVLLNEGKHHDHLVCMQCGRVEEFYDAEIEKRQTKVAKDRGFEISEHALYLYADCTKPRCPYRKTVDSN